MVSLLFVTFSTLLFRQTSIFFFFRVSTYLNEEKSKFSYISARNPISRFYAKAKTSLKFIKLSKNRVFEGLAIDNIFPVKIGIPVFCVIFNFFPLFSFADQDQKRLFSDVVNHRVLKNILIHLKFCIYESLFFYEILFILLCVMLKSR